MTALEVTKVVSQLCPGGGCRLRCYQSRLPFFAHVVIAALEVSKVAPPSAQFVIAALEVTKVAPSPIQPRWWLPPSKLPKSSSTFYPAGDCRLRKYQSRLPPLSRWWLPPSKFQSLPVISILEVTEIAFHPLAQLVMAAFEVYPKSFSPLPGGDCRTRSHHSRLPLLPRWWLPPSKLPKSPPLCPGGDCAPSRLPKSSPPSTQVVVAALEVTRRAIVYR